MSSRTAPSLPAWRDARPVKVLGTGAALPGPPVSTDELLERIERRFGARVRRHGAAVARRLHIGTRHLCRDLAARHEAPRPGHSNPELAAAALREALAQARIEVEDLAFLIGHTTSPACLVPPNVALVADHLGFAGPFMELRQACTGFANALIIAQGLLARADARPVAIIGSETGSVLRAMGPLLFAHGARVARSLGIAPDRCDHVIPHQANGRMAELLGPHLGIDPARVFVHADRVGNTGSAAIWLALATLRPSLAPGARVLALGAEATKYMFGGFSYVHG